MLKGIPSILTPDLIKILMEMGHGDELLLADGNYPMFGQPERIVHLEGHSIPEILEAILKFMPLDTYVKQPVSYMAVLPEDPYIPVIWETYENIIKDAERRVVDIAKLEKPEFYQRGQKSYAVIKSGEQALYANVILKKGVVNS